MLLTTMPITVFHPFLDRRNGKMQRTEYEFEATTAAAATTRITDAERDGIDCGAAAGQPATRAPTRDNPGLDGSARDGEHAEPVVL